MASNGKLLRDVIKREMSIQIIFLRYKVVLSLALCNDHRLMIVYLLIVNNFYS